MFVCLCQSFEGIPDVPDISPPPLPLKPDPLLLKKHLAALEGL